MALGIIHSPTHIASLPYWRMCSHPLKIVCLLFGVSVTTQALSTPYTCYRCLRKGKADRIVEAQTPTEDVTLSSFRFSAHRSGRQHATKNLQCSRGSLLGTAEDRAVQK